MAGSIESETGSWLLRREDCPKELLQVFNLRWISRVRKITITPSQLQSTRKIQGQGNSRVRPESNILQSHLLHHLRRQFTKRVRHNLIIQTMCEENRSLLIRPVVRDVVLDAVTEKQVAGETEDTTQLVVVRDTGENGHGTSLRETTENNPRWTDSLFDLFCDQSVEVIPRTQNAWLVLVADGVFEIELW